MRVLGYLRVSTDEQRHGPKAQRDAILGWAKAHDAEVVAWFEDQGVSGGAPIDKRTGLLEAIDAIRTEQAEAIVAAKRDRIAREVILAATIERLVEREGARLLTADGIGADDSPESALMRTMMDALAQYERAIIRGRTKAALAAKRRRGETYGNVPFGYRVQGDRLHLDKSEQAVIDQIRGLAATGLGYRAIARTLNENGTPCRSGPWHPQKIKNILVRTP